MKNNIFHMIGKALKKTAYAASYVVSSLILPLSVSLQKKETGEKGRSIVFDLPWQKSAIFGMTYFVLQPLSLFLFPRADTFARQQGLDPAEIKQVTTAKDIRIIPDNFAGKAYYILSHPPLFKPVKLYTNLSYVFNDGVTAFRDIKSTDWIVNRIAPDVERIYIKDKRQAYDDDQAFAKKYFKLMTGGQHAYINPLKAQEKYLFTFMHELRHTDPANNNLSPLSSEGDADYHAGRALSIALKRPTLAQERMNLTAYFNWAGTNADMDELIHDTALYTYLRHQGMKIPDEKTLMQVNIDAAPAIEAFEDAWYLVDGAKERYDRAYQNLSELAKTKVEVYKSAFMSLVKPVPTAQHNKPSS